MKSGDEVYKGSFNFPRCGWDQKYADFKRLSYRERVSCYSCLVLYLHGESNDSINGILLENIDKEIPIKFSLLITPVKDTPSVNKTSAISKLGN